MDTKELITEICADGGVVVLDGPLDENGSIRLPKNVVKIADKAFKYSRDSIRRVTLDSFSDLRVLDNLKLNGCVKIASSRSFYELSYGTLLPILDKHEEAFHKGEDGGCLFDESWLVFWDMEGKRYSGPGFWIGDGIMAVAMDTPCPQIPTFVQWYNSPHMEKEESEAAVLVAILDGDMWENVRVPIGLSQLIFQQRISLSELDFYGPLPDLHLCEGTKVKMVRINAPIKETALPSCLREAIEDTPSRHNWNLIFAAPALCEEESSVSGYIKVTCYESSYRSLNDYSKCHDSVIEINLRYIMFVEPLKLKCYSPMVGSRIHLASFQREGHTFVDVYEPADVVMNKIKTASSKLDANTIMGELETILHSCNQE